MRLFRSSKPDPALEFFPQETTLYKFKIKVYPLSKRMGAFPDDPFTKNSKCYAWTTQFSHTESWLQLSTRTDELGKISTSDAREITITLDPKIPSPHADGTTRTFHLRRTETERGGHEWRLPLPAQGDIRRSLHWRIPPSLETRKRTAYLAIDDHDDTPLALEIWHSTHWIRSNHPQFYLRADLGLGMETLVLLASLGAGDLATMHGFMVEDERKRLVAYAEHERQKARGGRGGGGDGGGGSGGMDGGGGGNGGGGGGGNGG